MMKKIIFTTLSLIAGIGLIYFGLKLFLSPGELRILTSKSIGFHAYALLLIIPIYMFNGVQTYILFKRMYKKNISLYDVLTLPLAVSLWGFLIPFQGAYVYNSIYFKAKYKIAITNTTSISIMSLSISLLMAGLLGIIYSFYAYQNIYFLLLSGALLMHPIFIFVSLRISTKFKFPEHGSISNILNKAKLICTDYINALTLNNVLVLIILNLIDSLGAALWTYWASINLGLDLSFFQLLLLQLFIKVTILFKFTPGNLGVVQFASSGIILLIGGTTSDGFTLSLYQSAITILISFILGTIFTLVNIRYFLAPRLNER